MDVPPSPAALSDAALDELDDAEGVFFSPRPPQEQYYQTRLTRSRQHQTNMQKLASPAKPRIAALDFANETARGPAEEATAQDYSGSPIANPSLSALLPTSPLDSTTADVQTALVDNNIGMTPTPQQPGDATANTLLETATPLSVDDTTSSAEAEVDVRPADSTSVQERHASPSTSPHCLPAEDHPTLISNLEPSDLISFDSQQTLSTPTIGNYVPIQLTASHLLDATPNASPSKTPRNVKIGNQKHMDLTVENLIFSPATTASFLLEGESVPVNTVLLSSKEKDRPSTDAVAVTQPFERERPDHVDNDRPVKRVKMAETPLKVKGLVASTTVRPSTPSRGMHTPSLLRQSGHKPSTSAVRTPQKTPMRLHPVTSRALQSSVRGTSTPVRPIATPRRQPSAAPRVLESTVKHSIPIILGETIVESSPTSRPAPLPDFKFHFTTHTQPVGQPQPATPPPNGPRIAIPLDDFKFSAGRRPSPTKAAPFRNAASPSKPSVSRLPFISSANPEPILRSKAAAPIQFNRALLSPRKEIASSPTKAGPSRSTVLGSPVRPARGSAGAAPPLPPPRLNLTAMALKKSVSQVPTQAARAPASPLKTLNAGGALAKAVLPSSAMKASALPMPKGFKATSKLPRPAATGLPIGLPLSRSRLNPPTVTVNMVHVPIVELPEVPETRQVAAPVPPKQRKYRAVVPGTLTGWEGKPAAPAQEAEAEEAATGSGSDNGGSSKDETDDSSPKADRPRRQASQKATETPSASTNPNDSDGSPSPRRSRRLSKEKENPDDDDSADPQPSVAETLPAETESHKRSTAKRALSTAKPRSLQPPLTIKMSDGALLKLTNKNTAVNQNYFNDIDVQIVRRDIPRPPSPTSKVRKLIGSTEDSEEKLEQTKKGRAERAKRRGLMEDEMDREEDDEQDGSGEDQPSKHFRGAGDEEDYETPKRRKVDGSGTYVHSAIGDHMDPKPFASLKLGSPMPKGAAARSREASSSSDSATERFVKPNSKGRFVKWDRKLVFDFETEKFVLQCDKSKGILTKTAAALGLDPRGNHPEAGVWPEDIQKDKVVVVKLVYADDPDPEAYQPSPTPSPSPSPPPPKRSKGSKRKRT